MIEDMPKLECPFIRKEVNGDYLITPEITPGFEWVFEEDGVWVEEKLHGTNVSIYIQNGVITGVFNRTERIPFFNHGKKHIIDGLLNSYERGMIDLLPDGQHFGECIGPKINGNPYKLKEHLWVPFDTFTKKHLSYKSWGKYPKTFESIEEWMKTLMPLYYLMIHGSEEHDATCEGSMCYCKQRREKLDTFGFVEGIVFKHPDGRLAKIRKDMYPWFKGTRHKE
jgi:hypothetical protein